MEVMPPRRRLMCSAAWSASSGVFITCAYGVVADCGRNAGTGKRQWWVARCNQPAANGPGMFIWWRRGLYLALGSRGMVAVMPFAGLAASRLAARHCGELHAWVGRIRLLFRAARRFTGEHDRVGRGGVPTRQTDNVIAAPPTPGSFIGRAGSARRSRAVMAGWRLSQDGGYAGRPSRSATGEPRCTTLRHRR